MTAAYPLLIPPQHRLPFDLSQKLGVGLVQGRPTPLSCHQLNIEQLTEIVAQTGEEAEVLRPQRVRREVEDSQVGRDINGKALFKGEKSLFKLL